MAEAFLGVDVGTGSARAGLFDKGGRLLAAARREIRIWREDPNIVEQSSDDIWRAICESVRAALAAAGLAGEDVKGLGFDATCSLVVLDRAERPLTVSPSGAKERNVIVWMDHRALEQTACINATNHAVLRYVGGRISPEMQTPKLLWLKENLPQTFHAAGDFFDLADYLSFRATGSRARSACTLTCKWTYLAHERRFDADYFRTIGLGELADEGFARIGTQVVDVATPLGAGLTEAAANDLGLVAGTPVGASLIDAHAGGVGTVGGATSDHAAVDPTRELAFIMGTSSCTMTLTREPVFVDGVWGPYYGAMIPGTWLLEGGQSAYGAALDYLVTLHPAFAAAKADAANEGVSVLDLLERRAVAMAGSLEAAALLGAELIIVPEFLGNRSPEADPHARAAISGMTLAASEESLIRLFVAALCGLCYGTRQIVEANRAKGLELGTIVASGGASRSALLRQILADATGLTVTLPQTPEPVLLGSAMIGAVARGAHDDLSAAALAMCRIGAVTRPTEGPIAAFHAAKFTAYEALQRCERQTRALIEPYVKR
ncbi:FGGY-family carbohydrate kinase [Jiella sp. MQZ9-1]|uniref:FGGY-family carbohydrate kinase n=1 Tax=Jiella flava TaxID=2816857 RepID=A0A939FVT5_9HYPH|nr:FGGY-family carbohydrate kinase [Jiella flava]MBO0661090.1 FGGY-family carbohydrate kinase [Jiella flava]MCD2469737.1 FGGY-family carbohydrate kinase [Jiella flava]